MSSDSTVTSVFSKRLKQARLRTDLTQEQLGILAGIDEFSASARVNQYEKGKHLQPYRPASGLRERFSFRQASCTRRTTCWPTSS